MAAQLCVPVFSSYYIMSAIRNPLDSISNISHNSLHVTMHIVAFPSADGVDQLWSQWVLANVLDYSHSSSLARFQSQNRGGQNLLQQALNIPLIYAHITENKIKQYSHRQFNQNSKGLLMDSGSLIMIVNNPKLLGKSYHPHDLMFKYEKPRSEELWQRKPRSEEFKWNKKKSSSGCTVILSWTLKHKTLKMKTQKWGS